VRAGVIDYQGQRQIVGVGMALYEIDYVFDPKFHEL
jgi:hypothetical protein